MAVDLKFIATALMSLFLVGCQSSTESSAPKSTEKFEAVSIQQTVAYFDQTCGPSGNKPVSALGENPKSKLPGLEIVIREIKSGEVICWIKSSYDGDLIALQGDLGSRFGGARHSDIAMLGVSRILQYDRGPNGKMLLLMPDGRAGKKPQTYLLGSLQPS